MSSDRVIADQTAVIPRLSVDTTLEAWLPSVRFIPSKVVSTDKRNSERSRSATPLLERLFWLGRDWDN